jgi:hypothetical protein
MLAALVSVVEGEGHLHGANLAEAEQAFDSVLNHHDEVDHPLAVAGARRGMGRIYQKRGDLTQARQLLSQSMEGFRVLHRVQEVERTRMFLAELALEEGASAEAARLAKASLDACGKLRVRRDVERAQRIMTLAHASGLEKPKPPEKRDGVEDQM